MARSKRTSAAALQPPEPITARHELQAFDCGDSSLNEWLRRRAIRNEASNASRTYVVCRSSEPRVIAFYSLAAGAIAHATSPGHVRRNMPDPIPVLVIGRLAVDASCQGQGIGHALLRDAIIRTLQAADIAGIRAILVHAISAAAKSFYLQCGFRASPIDEMTLMLTLSEAKQLLRRK